MNLKLTSITQHEVTIPSEDSVILDLLPRLLSLVKPEVTTEKRTRQLSLINKSLTDHEGDMGVGTSWMTDFHFEVYYYKGLSPAIPLFTANYVPQVVTIYSKGA